MNFNNQNLARISLLLSLAIVFSIIGYYIPVLSFLTFFVGSIFVIIGLFTQKISYALISFLAYVFLTFMFLDPITATAHIFVVALPCLVMGSIQKNPENEDTAYLIATILSAFATICIFSFLGPSIMNEFFEILQQSLANSNEMVKSLNFQNVSTISSEEIIDIVKTLMPSLIIVGALLNILISKYLGFAIFKRIFPKEGIKFKPFREFAISDKLGFIFSIFVIISFILQYLNIASKYISQISLNITFIILYMLFIQGFAVLMFTIRRLKGPVRIMITMVIILLISNLFLILPFVAIFDMMFDLRKLRFRRPK